MLIEDMQSWLRPSGDEPVSGLRPELAAAALLVAGAHERGRYTDVERDLVSAALMKLLMVPNPEAKALRLEAEETLRRDRRSAAAFTGSARELDGEERESLVTHLWRLTSEAGREDTAHGFMTVVAGQLGFGETQALALRPAADR